MVDEVRRVEMVCATQRDASRMSEKRVSRRAAAAPIPWLSHVGAG
jgi:hypothetical protein